MAADDLAFVYSAVRDGVAITNSQAGGQAWTPETQDGEYRIFRALFNGSWSADPTFTASGSTEAFTGLGHVFRSSIAGGLEVDVALGVGAISAGGGVKTIPGITTLTDGALVIVGWAIPAIEDWSALTGGWTTLGTQDHTNTGGSDLTLSMAHKVMGAAGPTGDVAQTSANGFDPGRYFIMAFKEAVSGTPTERSRGLSLEQLTQGGKGFSAKLTSPGWWRERLESGLWVPA